MSNLIQRCVCYLVGNVQPLCPPSGPQSLSQLPRNPPHLIHLHCNSVIFFHFCAHFPMRLLFLFHRCPCQTLCLGLEGRVLFCLPLHVLLRSEGGGCPLGVSAAPAQTPWSGKVGQNPCGTTVGSGADRARSRTPRTCLQLWAGLGLWQDHFLL